MRHRQEKHLYNWLERIYPLNRKKLTVKDEMAELREAMEARMFAQAYRFAYVN